MRLNLIKSEGFKEAMLGAMLSYGKTDFDIIENYAQTGDIPYEIKNRFIPLSHSLVKSGAGHDKFLEQIQYWLAIQAPLFWWKQFDTYRIGVSKSSESTMHKSWKNGLTQDMFEYHVFDYVLDKLNELIAEYMSDKTSPECKKQLFSLIANNLPDGYLQTRMVNINAKTLRNIYKQRRDHKLPQWRMFCDFIKNLPHYDLITME